MPWDWIVIDLSYVLVLVGGAMVFRARRVGMATWTIFGTFAAVVGAALFYLTYDAQQAFQAAEGGVSAMMASGFEC